MNCIKIYQASPYMTHRFWNGIRDVFRGVSRHGFGTNANRPKISVFAPVGGMSCDPLWLRSLGGGVLAALCGGLVAAITQDWLQVGVAVWTERGCARSGPFGSLPLRQSPKAPPLTRITMPRPMRTMGKRMCSQRSSTSAIGGRVATNFARATRTATSARKTMQ